MLFLTTHGFVFFDNIGEALRVDGLRMCSLQRRLECVLYSVV
jgi:hypothetical protein